MGRHRKGPWRPFLKRTRRKSDSWEVIAEILYGKARDYRKVMYQLRKSSVVIWCSLFFSERTEAMPIRVCWILGGIRI